MIIFGISSITVAASTIGFAKGYVYVADQTMDEESVIETGEVIDYKIEREEKIRNHANTKINKITTSEIMPKVNNPRIIDIKIKPKEDCYKNYM